MTRGLDKRLIARMLDSSAKRLEYLERRIAEATGFNVGDFVRVEHDSYLITSFSWTGPSGQEQLWADMKNDRFWTSRPLNKIIHFRNGHNDIPYWALDERTEHHDV